MPDPRPNVIERAFAIAREGKLMNIGEITLELSREGYLDCVAQLGGRAIRRQISQLIAAARKAKDAQHAATR